MKKANPTFRVLAVVLLLASLGMSFLPWLVPGREFADLPNESIFDIARSYWETTKKMMADGFDLSKSTTADILFSAAMILVLVTAILGIVLAACGLRWGGIPYAVFAVILTAVFFFYFLKYGNSYFYQHFGVRPFHMGIGAILFALLAIAAALCLLLPKKAAVPAEA
jgi:hypothetical protein